MAIKNWKLKPKVPQEITEKFPEYNPLVLQLLYDRGLIEKDQIDEFLHPDYEKLHDPFLFQDMRKAVGRVWQAIENKEKIFIYGDYDADAVTANAVLQQTFRYLGVEVESYVPDRFTEGYGLNLEAFAKIKSADAKLVITVDCGTNSVDAAQFCKQNGIDLIITDHHIILDGKPDAFALINPKNPDDSYPYQDITGVGVAFKLAMAILKDARTKTIASKYVEGYEKWLLDLVAIGTVADCHSLVGENRILVKYGLKVLAKTRWPGLKALIAVAGLDFNQRAPDAYALGFVIAPRINAAGRLEHANIALNLLLQKDSISSLQIAQALEEIEHKIEIIGENEAVEAVKKLEKLNRKRKETTDIILSEVREKIIGITDRKLLAVMGDWNKGVVGLVAGKIAEEYYRPAIVLSVEGEEAVGSARSVGEFNIMGALEYASEFLIKFGGHQQAAGLTLRKSDFEAFYQKILEYADQHLSEEDTQKTLMLEAEISSAHLTLDTLAQLQEFEPFGVGNPRPKFKIPDCKITSFREVGNGQKHLQLTLQKNNTQVASIAFNMGYFAKTLKIGDTVGIAAEIIEDGWNGRKEIKLRIVDIKNHSNILTS